MTPLSEQSRQFWSAAYFWRRAGPERDRRPAIRTLMALSATATDSVRNRTILMMKEMTYEPDRNPPGAA